MSFEMYDRWGKGKDLMFANTYYGLSTVIGGLHTESSTAGLRLFSHLQNKK